MTKRHYNASSSFRGDPDIDLTKYAYGRPSMSKEQRQKISDVQLNLNKKTVHNDKYKLSYWVYLDYFNEFESDDWKKGQIDYKHNREFIKIVTSLKKDMIDEGFFEYEKLFFHPPCLSKRKRIVNPGFFDLCSPILEGWIDNPNFKEDLKKFIKDHKDEIDLYSKKYLKQI